MVADRNNDAFCFEMCEICKFEMCDMCELLKFHFEMCEIGKFQII